MAAHQYDTVAIEASRQIAALRHVRHQKVGMISEIVGDVPYWYMRSHETAGVYDRPQRRCRDAEGQNIFGMGVHDCVYVGTRFVDRTVNKSFEIRRATVADRIAVQSEFHDIGALDQLWTA